MNPDTQTNRPSGLKSVVVLAADRPHGDRLRYMSGCRCRDCRAANSAYERSRQAARRAGEWNGYVSAERARRHLAELAAQGVGRRAVADACDVADSIVAKIKSGKRLQIRAETERRILAVSADMAADRALIPAGPTWRLLDELIAAGFTKTFIAQRLGYTRALQIGRDTVTVKNAARVRRLHRELIAADEALVDAKPARRHIERLREEGYTEKRIERELDLPGGLANLNRPRITRSLDRLVKHVFERLTT